eukprot:TRINITY_DN5492_c0_g1_i1.p1 TRINITY_DN5492_c0_g1~~TRINITY_DN5492_c0_g1_i1.p1  ORF type:complete len:371 (+),score=71.98 TRINITY_DN5492_c0_g1_i1:252-1364(+)
MSDPGSFAPSLHDDLQQHHNPHAHPHPHAHGFAPHHPHAHYGQVGPSNGLGPRGHSPPSSDGHHPHHPHHLPLQSGDGGPNHGIDDDSVDSDGGHVEGELIITHQTGLEEGDDDDDDLEGPPNKKMKGDDKGVKTKKKTGGSGRRRIEIKYIDNKSRRQVTFSRRKRGLMKKAYELTTLTGTQALVLIASETGHVYTFATPKLQPVVTLREGKELIQSCLNAPDNNYPPSEFLPNTNSGNNQGGGQSPPSSGGGSHGSHQAKPEPHQSPMHPQHLQQGHGGHNQHGGHVPMGQHGPAQHGSMHHHDPAMMGLYGAPQMQPPHMHSSYPQHMPYAQHDHYVISGSQPQPLPSMHLPHHDASKGQRDHGHNI